MMVTPAWGVSAERYEEMYIETAKRLGVPELGSPIVPFIGRDARVLDLGCATGWQARLLAERGCTVVGVEVDAKAAARATPWCERVIVCDLDVVDLPTVVGPDSFDAVAAGDIIEHLRDPARLLRSVAALLRPGGRVVASIPNVAHGSVRLALLTGAFPYADAGLLDRTHLRFFTRTSVQELFASAGFEIEQLERVQAPIDRATPYDRTLLVPGIEEAVASMPEANTFEFVVVARPIDRAPIQSVAVTHEKSDPDEQSVLLAAQADALRALDETIRKLRRDAFDYERQLEEIQSSRVWRTWRQFRPIVTPALARWRRILSRLSASRSRSSRH